MSKLGPIGRELRRVGTCWWYICEPEAYELWLGARLSLGLAPVNTPAEGGVYAIDIASEAIEAAEALSL